MPTFNRAQFIPDAIKMFQTQDYSELELIVVDSGTDETHRLFPADDPRITYFHADHQMPCGEARNKGTELASGAIIINTDDDDWYSPDRVSRQIAFHLASQKAVTGYSYVVFHDLTTGAFNRYTMADPYFSGTSIVYDRDYWQNVDRIDPINAEEDTRFVSRASRRNESARNTDDSTITIVARTHHGNSVSRDPLYRSPQWVTEPRPKDYPLDIHT